MPEISLTRAPAHVRHGSNIGQPLTRREGVLKVKGEARYAADNHPPGMLYAALAVSSIARGRVTFLDVEAAKRHPGVVEVMTPANRPALAEDPDAKTNPFMFRLDLLQNDRVRYANQTIAVVIAETLEAATEGAALLAPRYDTEPARVGLDAAESFVPPGTGRRRDRPCGWAPTPTASSRRSITTRRPPRAPSTISSSRHPTPPTRSMRAQQSPRRTKPCGSIPARRSSCARPERRQARSRS